MPHSSPPSSGPDAASGGAVARGQAHVLLVEDDRDAAELMAELIGCEGYRVSVAHSGAQALGIATATPQPIDALITDLNLPDMQGVALAAELRRLLPELRCCIALSGYAPHEMTAMGAADVFTHLLQKPVDLEALTSLLAAR